MALTTLAPKPGAPIIDSGDFLAFLKVRGVTVHDDTVIARSDGSVDVDAEGDVAAAWAAYVPPAPVELPTLREELETEITAITTVAGLRTYIHDRLIPLIAPE